MRIRTIKPEFWKHPVMATLPDHVQLLAIALLSTADDRGYFRSDPRVIRGEVMPFRDDLKQIRESLARLREIGWINTRTHPEQGEIGQITNWSKHQRVDHPTPSKLECYFLANESRDSREDSCGEQGTGKGREQGTGSDEIAPILEYLNAKTGRKFRVVPATAKLIKSRLDEDGVTIEGIQKMIDRQCMLWLKDAKMCEYLRPETLFNATKFNSYYAAREVPTAKPQTLF